MNRTLVDDRLGRVLRYFVAVDESPPMLIPDDLRKCVTFVMYRQSMADGPRVCGTAFFVGRQDDFPE